MRKILVAEDEAVLRESYGMVLSFEPYQVHMAEDGGRALELCREITFDLILLDLRMPKVSGVMFLEQMHEQNIPLPKIIVISNLSSGKELTHALALGAHRAAVKADLSPKQLLALIRYELGV
jgi:two-component system, NtrC family, nitrogen regulation response regulator NtrX